MKIDVFPEKSPIFTNVSVNSNLCELFEAKNEEKLNVDEDVEYGPPAENFVMVDSDSDIKSVEFVERRSASVEILDEEKQTHHLSSEVCNPEQNFACSRKRQLPAVNKESIVIA